MLKIDIAAVPERKGTGYPPQFNVPCAERIRQRLGNAGGFMDFRVNLMRLPPDNWSSQRHGHSHEDKFVYVLAGELVLIENEGEAILRAGDCAAFPKGTGNGHHRGGDPLTLSLSHEGRGNAVVDAELIRHRHDERQCRRTLHAQGRLALSRVMRHRLRDISAPAPPRPSPRAI